MPINNRFFGNPPDPQLLVQIGPVLAVEVSVPSALAQFLASQGVYIPPPVTGLALIDTGATKSCVDDTSISRLGISPVGVATTGTAGGLVQQNVYPVRLRFPGLEGNVEFEFSTAIGVNLQGQTQNLIALLGRDVLSVCMLVYNGPGGFFSLNT
ncbi:MAG: hypothetical protein NVS2B14_17770 [Chamaesiphon sp.]